MLDQMERVEELLVSDPTLEEELPTNELHSGSLETISPSEQTIGVQTDLDNIDWLATLTARHDTEPLHDDPPEPQPAPSGMAHHSAPPRMAPTWGARLATWIKRSALLLVLSGLAISVVAAGGYALVSTSWPAAFFAPQTPPAGPTQGQAQPAPQSYQLEQPRREPLPGTSAIVLRDRGVEAYRAGNFSQAIALLEAAVAQNGDDAIAYYQLGLALLAVGDQEHSLDDAEMAFRTAASLQPEWAAPQQGLAESLLRRGFFNEAIPPAQQATKLDSTMSEAWVTLGRAYQGANRDADATRAFAEATRHSLAPPLP